MSAVGNRVLLTYACAAAVMFGAATPVLAQSPVAPAGQPAPPAATTPAALRLGSVLMSGTFRTRTEAWDWFAGDANNSYVFQGSLLRLSFAQTRRRVDWQVEMAAPVLLGLPDDAVAPGVQGGLGIGANYFVSNGRSRNAANLFPKQAFVRFKNLAGRRGQQVGVGRLEFIEGTEVMPANGSLAALKRDHVAHRLIGNFGFTHVMRSFDGVEYGFQTPRTNVTVLAARPTQGVFQVNGWRDLNATVVYGAVTHQMPSTRGAGEWRAFVIQADDFRDVVKTDNRPLAARTADAGALHVTTIGGHYIRVVERPWGDIDALVWGAGQVGRWGRLDQRAASIVGEVGWQPKQIPALKPWLRAGALFASGDGDPSDARHATFFQLFPTARWYSRFPFYALMNLHDEYGSVLLRPHPKVSVRTEVHVLRVADTHDLWYQGGGAFQPATFGYTGKPSGGQSRVATLYDTALDVTINRRLALTGYAAAARGGGVAAATYPQGPHAALGFVEANVRF